MATQKEISAFIAEFNESNETQLIVTEKKEESYSVFSDSKKVRNKILIELIKGDARIATKTKKTTKTELLETLKWFIQENNHFVIKKQSMDPAINDTTSEKIDIFSMDFLFG